MLLPGRRRHRHFNSRSSPTRPTAPKAPEPGEATPPGVERLMCTAVVSQVNPVEWVSSVWTTELLEPVAVAAVSMSAGSRSMVTESPSDRLSTDARVVVPPAILRRVTTNSKPPGEL